MSNFLYEFLMVFLNTVPHSIFDETFAILDILI